MLRQALEEGLAQRCLAPGSSATEQQKLQIAAIITKEMPPLWQHQFSDPCKSLKPEQTYMRISLPNPLTGAAKNCHV